MGDVSIDDPGRFENLRSLIKRKGFLEKFYREIYSRYAETLARCPQSGVAIELGSGAGFVKEVIPEVVTSDVIPYEGVDRELDACALPFEDRSLRAILMFDVFHHIPDVEKFLTEADRCLKPGGRCLIIDPYLGWLTNPIFRFIHHEPFHPEAPEWRFESKGPLSDANVALAWMVFQRDRERFEKVFPRLRVDSITPHSPLRYWLAGGLRKWSLAPSSSFGFMSKVDEMLVKMTPRLASFMDVELVKTGEA
jgi:SAM-dependent methyltransferase